MLQGHRWRLRHQLAAQAEMPDRQWTREQGWGWRWTFQGSPEATGGSCGAGLDGQYLRPASHGGGWAKFRPRSFTRGSRERLWSKGHLSWCFVACVVLLFITKGSH